MEWKTFERLASMALFSLVVMVIFNFAFDLVTIRRLGASKLVPGVLWITLAFSGIIGFTRSFQLEHRHDSMIALMLAPPDRGAIFLGKMIANLTTVWILQIVIVPLSAVFFNYDLVSVATRNRFDGGGVPAPVGLAECQRRSHLSRCDARQVRGLLLVTRSYEQRVRPKADR